MQIYLPIAEVSVNAFPSPWVGRVGRHPVRHVRCRRRLSDDAASVFHRHSASRGRGDRGQPDRGLVLLGRAGTFAAKNGRFQNGDGPDNRGRRGRGCGRAGLCLTNPVGAGRSARPTLLRGVPGRDRIADVCRVAQRDPPGAQSADRSGPGPAPAWLGRCPPVQDAIPHFRSVYFGHPTASGRRFRWRSGGDHGGRRRLHHGARDDLPAGHADQKSSSAPRSSRSFSSRALPP